MELELAVYGIIDVTPIKLTLDCYWADVIALLSILFFLFSAMRAPGTVQAAAAVLQQQQQQQQATQGQVQNQNVINNSMTAPPQVMVKK